MPKNYVARSHAKLNRITALTNIVNCIETEAWDSVVGNCSSYKNTYNTEKNNPALHSILTEIESTIHIFDDDMKALQNQIYDCVGV